MSHIKFTFSVLLLCLAQSIFGQNVLMQNGSITQCNGNFLDTGGATGNYGADENLVFTICPTTPGDRVRLSFTEFDIAVDGDDTLAIYDGDSADPSNLIGSFTGDLASNPSLSNIVASNGNPTGCLTVVFTSNATVFGTGWQAQISCLPDCPSINPGVDSISPVNFDGENYLGCFGDVITFDANNNLEFGDSSLVTYQWDFGNGDIDNSEIGTTVYSEPGFYTVSLTASLPNCSSETILLDLRIGNEPIIEFTSFVEEICAGEQVELTANATTEIFYGLCGLPVSVPTALPDGTGASYTSSILADCFDENQVITSGSDIVQVCINIEHAFLGDLDIVLIAPNGSEVILKPFSSFPGNENVYLGEATENATPGNGFEYCFTASASDLLVDGNTVQVPDTSDPGNTQPSIEAGDYLPFESFDNLIGSPLNGDWTIQITDNISQDDGWIFEWYIDFDTNIVPLENTFQPQIIKQEWIGFPGQGNTIFVTKPTEGEVCYEFEVIDTFGCTWVEEICVDYLPTPNVGPVQDLYECDQDPTTDSSFNLTINTASALGVQDPTLYTITYHLTLEDANTGANPITPANDFTPPESPFTVYLRMVLNSNGCFKVRPFDLIDSVFHGPTNNLQTCSIDGQIVFDLTQQNSSIFGPDQNATSHTITFHNTETDAEFGINPIANPDSYPSTTTVETIWTRIVDNGDTLTCFAVDSFDIIVNEQPEIISDPLDLEECFFIGLTFDLTVNNQQVMGISPTINSVVTYHNTEFDALNGLNPIANPSDYNIQSIIEVIWVRVENSANSDCFDVSNFEIRELQTALINTTPDPIIVCDDDNDGFYNLFDLTEKGLEISFGNPVVNLSYHLTELDAINNVGALSSPYANVVEGTQTIYFRTEDTTTNCIQIGPLDLQVVDTPLLFATDQSLVRCDDNTDQQLFFDLTEIESEFIGNLDPTTTSFTYHFTQADAQNGTNPIAVPTNYQNITNPQTIWIRSLDTSNAQGCYDVESFEIEVSSLPGIQNPQPFETCDDATGGSLDDEIATFNLNDILPELTVNNSELNVEFFETQADLQNNIPISNQDAYVNLTNPQTIYVRITSQTTGCERETSFSLVVNPTPSLVPDLDPLEICDPDNDGFGEFDLESVIPIILNNEPDVTISFHLTQAEANLGTNPIDTSDLYGTINPDQQTIYVRAENTGDDGLTGTGCFVTRPLDLIVNVSPEINDLEDLTRCDDDTLNGFASFDLTTNIPLAVNDQTDVEVTFHETQSDAQVGINSIAVPSNYINITNPQVIYVRIEDSLSGCYDLFDSTDDPNNTFTLTVEAYPVVNAPTALEVCGDPLTDAPFPQATFNLTDKEPEIIGNPFVPENISFEYFESQADLDNNTNAIQDPTAYTNTVHPQDIFVKVTDTDTAGLCYDTVILVLSVLPEPSPSETDLEELRIEVCDDDNDGVATLPIDLTPSGSLIAGSEPVVITYYTSQNGALNEDNEDLIATPDAYINDPTLNITDDNGIPTNIQMIYARVDNDVAGNFCFTIVPFEIVTLRAPELNPLGAPFAYTLCEDSTSDPGIATLFSISDITNNLWDFSSGDSSTIIPLLDPDVSPVQNLGDYTVTYHLSNSDAENGINPVNVGLDVVDNQTLYIRVTNSETGCYNANNISEVQIIVEPRPLIAPNNPGDIFVCSDDVSTPNTAFVDLTQLDETINPGSPANTGVLYFEGLDNYQNGIAITDPSNYETIQTPQQIIAVVIDTITLCESEEFVSFDVIVNPLVGDISGFDGSILCVDENGNVIDTGSSPLIIDTGLSSTNFSFSWELNGTPIAETTSSIVVTQAGTYTVVVENVFTGCVSTSSATITQNFIPTFDIEFLTTAFSDNQSVRITNIQGGGEFEFQLNDGEWIPLPDGETSITFTNVPAGLNTITGRDDTGCFSVVEEFTIIDYPPFFTPNQDGFNETWNIEALSNQPNAKIYIFDRYGKMLKQISPSGEGWDGTFNGKPMPAQDYWFKVDYIDPLSGTLNTFRSNFTLKR